MDIDRISISIEKSYPSTIEVLSGSWLDMDMDRKVDERPNVVSKAACGHEGD